MVPQPAFLVPTAVFAAALGFSTFLPACDCSAGNGDEGGGTTGPGSGGAGGEGLSFGIGGGGGGVQGNGCSADLKFVVDAAGNVLQQCGPEEGCAGGQCIPACEAAAASKGSIGCDFMLATPSFYVGILPPCFAAFVTNNWDKSAVLTISRGGVSYDATQFGRLAQADPNVAAWPAVPADGVPPGQVAVLFLSDDPASVNGTPLTCPIPPAIRGSWGTAVQGTGLGTGWSIKSNAPVTVYDILPYGGADSYLPSAELVQPVTAWGTNYVSVLPPPGNFGGPPWAQVTAIEENTTITVLPSVPLPGGAGVNAIPANTQGTITLQAGQYVQWESAEMTGSIIQSDKPVAFTGGSAYQCYSSATS
ncbi:MAG: IgGFc-binding protein, partial [Myxococcales bacterium]|nr:IgGFc-binding protein [Myxococcales bacterium]